MLRMNFDFCGWNDGYNVGDQTLDAQNKALIDLFGEILNALGDGGRIEATRQRFGKLMDHIREHFAAEERLMQEVEYACNGKNSGCR